MKKVLLALPLGFMALTAIARAAERPNIVLIYADDIGYGDLSCYGAKRVQTPRCDQLASQGLRFTDAHSSSATCTPSRYSLLTGEYAFRKPGTGILAGDAGLIIDTNHTTLPSMLKQAGYNTAIVGKWHLGLGGKSGPNWNGTIAPGPKEVGFDTSFIMPATADRVPTVYIEDGHIVGLDPKDPVEVSYKGPLDDGPTGTNNPALLKMPANPQHSATIVDGVSRIGWMKGGKAALWKDVDMADTFSQKAVSFLEKQTPDKPFFLYFATHNIHVPRVPNQRYVGKTPMGPRGDSIAEFDGAVGQVLDTLDRLKMDKSTLVILSSDNGPVINDGYTDDSIRKLGDHKAAGPFRGGKYSIYEGGTRMPMIVRWPGHIEPGVSGAMLCQVDLLASLASLTGQTVTATDAPDSQNMLSALEGKTSQGRTELAEYADTLAVRSGQWKYIVPGAQYPQGELYNLADDVAEEHNLVTKNSIKATEMADRLAHIKNAASTP